MANGVPADAGGRKTGPKPSFFRRYPKWSAAGGIAIAVFLIVALLESDLCSSVTCGAVLGWLDKVHCWPIATVGGKTPAPTFCEDPTRIGYNDHPAMYAKMIAYARNQVPWSGKGAPMQPLQPYTGVDVSGMIYAAKGARDLTQKDLARRGRIVAVITTDRSYEHGIHSGSSYVWVDYGPHREWRVLLISDDPRAPVSVLSAIVVTPRPPNLPTRGPTMASTGAFHVATNYERWINAMSPDVRDRCYADSLTACWVNAVKDNPPPPVGKTVRTAYDDSEPTDGWVWVTNYGCVCIGTSCHDLRAVMVGQ